MDNGTLIGYLINPITAAIAWIAGSRRRKNTAIQSLLGTNQLLSNTIQEYNTKIVSLMNEIQEVRRENAELKAGQQEMLAQIEALKTENRELNELVKAAGLTKPKPIRKPKTPNPSRSEQ